MLSKKSIHSTFFWVPVAGLLLFCCVISSWSLDIVSVVPADGTTRVDTAVTFQFEFDAPLDTTVHFEFPENFFLSMFFNEDLVGTPDTILVSPDLMTVQVVNLHLMPETRYVFGLIGAFSTTGDPLNKPVAFTFTTGDVLPTGTVSGTISSASTDPTNTCVLLFKTLFDEKPEAMAIVSSSEGTYTLTYVPGDTYLAAAAKDIDLDGEIYPDRGVDIVTAYDPDRDGFPDPVVTSEGSEMTGIDLTLTPWNPVTARQRYTDVEWKANEWSADAQLALVASSNVSTVGSGYMWIYNFYSPGIDDNYSIGASSEFVWEWIQMGDDDDEPMPDSIALPVDWIDSDVASDSAEAHGGGQFRAGHTDAEVTAFLGSFDMFGDDETLKSNSAAESTETQALWIYMYSSQETGDEFMIPLDARTGDYIHIAMPAPTAVRYNLDVVSAAAMDWAPDAALVTLGTHQCSLDPFGEAMFWVYIYASAGKDSVRGFFASNGMMLGASKVWEPPSRIALPEGWVDSDVVMAAVEAAGGADYRSENDSVYVYGSLSRRYNPYEPEEAAWNITYSSATSDPMTVYVDALTGRFMTDVESGAHDSGLLPDVCSLSQNYPNPFNPETDIRYEITDAQSPVPVALTIYNVIGQEVRTLVDQVQETGYYTVTWDGRDGNGQEVSSGIYVYRLNAGSFSSSRTMVLLR